MTALKLSLLVLIRKNRTISLSIKAKDQADEREAMDTLNQAPEEDSGLSAMAEAFKNAKL